MIGFSCTVRSGRRGPVGLVQLVNEAEAEGMRHTVPLAPARLLRTQYSLTFLTASGGIGGFSVSQFDVMGTFAEKASLVQGRGLRVLEIVDSALWIPRSMPYRRRSI